MKKRTMRLAALLMAGLMMLSGCSSGGAGGTEVKDSQTGTKASTSGGVMTDVGTPRAETLIVDMLSGTQTDPDNCNPYMTGCITMDCGLHQLIFPALWEVDTMKGEQICDLAADFPKAMDDTNTKFQFHIREGIKWSDGTDFTAEDVAYTSDVLIKTDSFSWSGFYKSFVKSMKAVDKYTIEMELVEPNVKPQQKLGVIVFGNNFKILPKHIWEKEDPATFKYTNPLSLGPYTLTKRDTQGNWFLYEKREDWKNTDVGIIDGEPKPQYILFKYFGSEEKRVMAAVNNELDVLMDISPESWDILREKNPNAKCWTKEFPYAIPDDPCERGVSFNCSNELYNNKEVRWALTLCMDIKQVSMATFGGKLKFSPIAVPPTTSLSETYQKPMLDWLKTYAFEDGYVPFNENASKEMVELLKSEGVEDLPADDKGITDTFGIGWWKYDTDKAAQLLEKNGFSLKDGKWMDPDGKPWEVVIQAPADFEIESMRLAFAVADAWNKFGVSAQVKQQDSSTYWTGYANGNYDVGAFWPFCGLLPDLTENIQTWHEKYILPNGENAAGNKERFQNEKISKSIDALQVMDPDDPKIITTVQDMMKTFVEEMPAIPMFGTAKFVPVVETYWKGFQDSENPFEGPWWWWSQFKFYTTKIEPVQAQ